MINFIERYILRYTFKARIVIFNVVLTIIAIVFFILVSYLFARNGVIRAVEERLSDIRNLKKAGLISLWETASTSIQIEASNPATIQAMKEFRFAFDELVEETGSREAAMRRLQQLYISENPFEIGKKHDLYDAKDGSEYSRLHSRYHGYYREILERNYLYDFFLVEPETGHILYTVFKENDFGTSLLDGRWKDTHIARVFKEARSSTDRDAIFNTDFEPYAPSNDDPAYFKATPIVENGRTIGVLMVQYSQSRLDEFIQYSKGMGKTGDVYIVGKDKLFRTNSRYVREHYDESTLLNEKYRVDTPSVAKAFNKESGTMVTTNYRGATVMSAYDSVTLDDNEYAVIAEMDTAEALEYLDTLLFFWAIIGVTILAIVIVATAFLAGRIASPVNEIIGVLTTSTSEIAATVDQQERTAQQQSTAVNQTSTTMSELGASSKQTAEQSESVAAGAREALSIAEEGTGMVEEMRGGMSEIKGKVSAIAEQISHLSEQTHQIGNITNFVGDLANQTNMLALNAAVEAVRAGEHGKGFAVVAAEIRKLADQSKKSAERIQNLVGEIQQATDSTVMATDDGTKSVDRSVDLAEHTATAFREVSGAMNRVVENTQQISLNVKQQSIAVNEVVQAMNDISSGARENAAGAAQTKQGVEQLNQAAVKLEAIASGGPDAYDIFHREISRTT